MTRLVFAEFSFDPVAGDLDRQGAINRLRPKTAKLLVHFLNHEDEILSRESILAEIWADRTVTDNTLMQSVRELRAALGDKAASPRFIETLHGRGYKWIGPAARDYSAPQDASPKSSLLPKIKFQLWMIPAAVLVVAVISVSIFVFDPFELRDPSDVVLADIARAEEAHERGRSDLAQRYFEAALLRDENNMAAMSGLALVFYESGDWDQASQLTSTGIEYASERPSPELAELHLIAARIASGRGQLEAARQHFLAARTQPNEISFSAATNASALSGISRVYADQGHIGEYLRVRAEAVDPLLMEAQDAAVAEGLLSAGTTVQTSVNESRGLARLARALELFEELNDARGIARTHAAIGANRALPAADRRAYLESALAHFRHFGHLPGELAVLREVSSLETEQFNADASLSANGRAHEIAEQLGARREFAALEYDRGLALMASAETLPQGTRIVRIVEAETAFAVAIDTYDELAVVFDGIAPRMYMAIAQLERQRPEQALRSFRDVERRYASLPFPPGIMAARMGEASSYYQLGQAEMANQILAELSATLPEAEVLFSQIRDLFGAGATMGSSPEDPSFFRIVITAERLLAETAAQ